jgi:hypothetical protein
VAIKLVLAALVGFAATAWAAGPDVGQAQQQATNWTAIGMFGAFVVMTLFITKWAASRTKSASDFYTAGGGIPVSRTAWRLPATTCPLPRSWASRPP